MVGKKKIHSEMLPFLGTSVFIFGGVNKPIALTLTLTLSLSPSLSLSFSLSLSLSLFLSLSPSPSLSLFLSLSPSPSLSLSLSLFLSLSLSLSLSLPLALPLSLSLHVCVKSPHGDFELFLGAGRGNEEQKKMHQGIYQDLKLLYKGLAFKHQLVPALVQSE